MSCGDCIHTVTSCAPNCHIKKRKPSEAGRSHNVITHVTYGAHL